MTMQDWETRLNRFLAATDREVLQDAGKISAEIARAHAESEFEKYRIAQDRLFESDFDRALQQLDATTLASDGDQRERTATVNVLEEPPKKPLGRTKGKDKGNS